MRRAHKGKFVPKNPSKYAGNLSCIIFRSSWELSVMQYFDRSSAVVSWNSEKTIIMYPCPLTSKTRRYYVDFKVTFVTGKTVLVEVKPEKQTKMPELKTKKPGKRHLAELALYAVNKRKWQYAKQYAERRGWDFKVWTERSLETLGIKLLR